MPAGRAAGHASSESFTLGFDSVIKDRRHPRAAWRCSGRLLIVSGVRSALDLPLNEASGGADRSRTDDLRLARAALSQLSYSPRAVGRLKASGRWWA